MSSEILLINSHLHSSIMKDNWCFVYRKMLHPCSIGADPTADNMTLGSAAKVGGLGQKLTKRAGKICPALFSGLDTSRLVWI